MLIPIKSPIKLQKFLAPETQINSKHHLILITILSLVMALVIVLSGFATYFKLLYKKSKMFVRNDSSLETSDLIPACKASKDETFSPKIIQDKLLPGVSGYLGKPIMYDLHVILKAALNFSEHNRIGGSAYKAIINEQVFAAEELQIIQRVNHVNLVKLMGVSSDNDGRLRTWMDPRLKGCFDTSDALSLANLARACTSEK